MFDIFEDDDGDRGNDVAVQTDTATSGITVLVGSFALIEQAEASAIQVLIDELCARDEAIIDILDLDTCGEFCGGMGIPREAFAALEMPETDSLWEDDCSSALCHFVLDCPVVQHACFLRDKMVTINLFEHTFGDEADVEVDEVQCNLDEWRNRICNIDHALFLEKDFTMKLVKINVEDGESMLALVLASSCHTFD